MDVLLKFIDSDYIRLFNQGAVRGAAGQFEAASSIVVVCRTVSCSSKLCELIQVRQEALIDCCAGNQSGWIQARLARLSRNVPLLWSGAGLATSKCTKHATVIYKRIVKVTAMVVT